MGGRDRSISGSSLTRKFGTWSREQWNPASQWRVRANTWVSHSVWMSGCLAHWTSGTHKHLHMHTLTHIHTYLHAWTSMIQTKPQNSNPLHFINVGLSSGLDTSTCIMLLNLQLLNETARSSSHSRWRSGALSPKLRPRAGQSQGIPFAHTSSSRSFLYDFDSLPPYLWMWFLSVLMHMVPFTLSFITTTSAKPVRASSSLACHNKVCSQPWRSRQTPKGQMTTSPCNSWIQNLSLGILAPLFSSPFFLTFTFFWAFYMWI